MFPVNPSPLLSSYESSTTDSPQLQLKSYKKKGYSVAISNGSLRECTDEKGVVLMENGTTFAIAITNSNDYGEKREIPPVNYFTLPDRHVHPTLFVLFVWETSNLFLYDNPQCINKGDIQSKFLLRSTLNAYGNFCICLNYIIWQI